MRIKKSGQIGLLVVGALVAFGVGYWWMNRPKEVGESHSIGKISIPDAPEASLVGTSAIKLPLPSKSEALNGGAKMTILEMAWNSQTSLNYANGGARTTKNSLLDKAHWDVIIQRQDDCFKAQADLIKWTNDYKNGSTKDGLVAIWMGTGVPNYVRGIAKAVEKLGPEYAPVAFFSSGKSDGEDQLIGPVEIKHDKQLLKGRIVRGVKLDGDLDIAIKFAGDNGIKVNQNDKIYDPEALNLSYSETYLTAVNDYNTGKQENRKLVRGGKTTKDTAVTIDMVATWTPGDVNAIVKGKGGATIISTRHYASMMPNIYVTCKKYLNDNRTKIEDFIKAVVQAGDQVRSYDDVKLYACGLNAQIWNEESGKYWYDLYNGKKHSSDAFLGGSMVYNLADITKLFGLNGSPDIYKEVYNAFGKVQSSLYPVDLPDIIDYSKAMDKSVIMSVVSNHPELLEGKALETQYSSTITETVASKDVKIQFEFGSDNILPESYDVLNKIYQDAITADGLKVGVYGHTDDIGEPSSNQRLSEQRAAAIETFLRKKGLPTKRIESKGFGEEQPIADNNSEQGRSQNRRVQIVLGQ